MRKPASGMTVDAKSGQPPENRRRHRRLPVTVCARVHHADVTYRTDILDVSDDGMLLASGGGLVVTRDQIVEVHSSALGKVQARVVGISPRGIHVQLESFPPGYRAAVERLFALTRAWLA